MPSAQTRTNPTERAVGRPDALDLYETLAVASNDVRAAARTVYAWRGTSTVDMSRVYASARHAAQRIIAALDAFEGDRT